MALIIYRTLYMFFVVLEFVLTGYVLLSWFPLGVKAKEFMNLVTAPILDPLRYLLRHSIFYSQIADLSPLVGFIIVAYLQRFFYIQLM